MRERVFGRTGVSVPVIGQGTWNMEQDDPDACVAALEAGLAAGMTHIDTAELYGSGKVERMVARVLKGGRREQVFLVSKVLPWNAARKGTVAHCERSLRRLGTDYLDVYLLHWPDGRPLGPTIEGLEQLERDGKIRAWGVSNFGVADLEEAEAIAGPGRIACNQVLYHLRERAIDNLIGPWCRERGIPIVAYSPFLTGKFPSPRSRGGQVLARVAARRGATPHQVALAFLCREAQTFAIPKAARVEHTLENAAAGDLELSRADVREIEAAFPPGTRTACPEL